MTFGSPAFLTLFLPLAIAAVALGRRLASRRSGALLAVGVAANLAALAWFKYALFFGGFVGLVTPGPATAVAVPLGLSFYTFQQIGYLVDVRRGHAETGGLLRFATFVSFFPQLVAGPIVRWRDFGPELDRLGAVRLDDPTLERGVLLIAFGLAKKTLIADPLGALIAPAWADPAAMTAYDAWVAVLG